MRVHVAFTPAEAAEAPTGLVVDVLRATSTISQALASGYGRVLCCGEVDEARALRESLAEGVLAGERACVRIEGFDRGNSPSEFTEGAGETVILTTTNGTKALVAAASRCDRVYARASLLNLGAVVAAAQAEGEDVAVICAGVKGEFVLDDAICAGRLVEALGGDPTDAGVAAMRLVSALPFGGGRACEPARARRNLLNAGLEEDIAWCARESELDVVPRLSRMLDGAAEIVL